MTIPTQVILNHRGKLGQLRASIRADKKQLKTTTKRLESSIERNQDIIDNVQNIWKVVDGVLFRNTLRAITAFGEEATKRYGEFYPNANNGGKTWGVHTYEDMYGAKGQQWHGAGWTSKTATHVAIIDWILTGKRPENQH